MNNHPNKNQKTPRSKKEKDNLKLLLDTNPHPKADVSTTPIGKKYPQTPKNTRKMTMNNHPNKIK